MTPSIWSLRPAAETDLEQVLRIEQQVQRHPWTEGNFQAEKQKPYSQFLVLTDDETDLVLAGYVIFWILFDECQILNVAVDLPFRGLGLGKFMLSKAIQIAMQAGAKKAVLEVRKSNTAAIQLYQSLNFTIRQVRKKFYGDGEDAYSMTLPLVEEGVDF